MCASLNLKNEDSDSLNNFQDFCELIKRDSDKPYEISLIYKLIPESISFQDAEMLLKDKNIDFDLRNNITSRISEVSFQEAEALLRDKDVDLDIKKIVTSKISPVSFEEVEQFLRDYQIDFGIKKHIAGKVTAVSMKEVEKFLKDDQINFIIGRIVSEKINEQFNFSNLLEKFQKTKNKALDVNKFQCSELGIEKGLASKTRSLVLYCRENQGFYERHFGTIARVLQEYISEQKSGVWNNFKIVTRHGDITSVGGIKTEEYSEGDKFISDTTIFADTIHLSHGTPESTPGTHSIIGKAIYKNPNKKELLENIEYTSLDLLYYEGIDTYDVVKYTGDDGLGFPFDTIESICSTLLDTIKQAENDILRKIKTPNEKVDSVLNQKE